MALKNADLGPMNRSEELSEAQRERLHSIAHTAWNDTVPFSPYSNVPMVLPTAWHGAQLRNMQIGGSDDAQLLFDSRVVVETGLRTSSVSSACADVPISRLLPMFYFEVLLSGCGGSYVPRYHTTRTTHTTHTHVFSAGKSTVGRVASRQQCF